MADSILNEEIFNIFEDRIALKKEGDITIRDAQFLMLKEIRDLLIQIEENTRPT